MHQKAMEMEVDGFVGIDIDCKLQENTGLMMISVNGIAVKF